jgi:hypothetical protein
VREQFLYVINSLSNKGIGMVERPFLQMVLIGMMMLVNG